MIEWRMPGEYRYKLYERAWGCLMVRKADNEMRQLRDEPATQPELIQEALNLGNDYHFVIVPFHQLDQTRKEIEKCPPALWLAPA